MIMYTATVQKAKSKGRMSMETTNTGDSSKIQEACRREPEHKLKTAVEHGANRTSETTRDHS
jgi:hypothetical protein